MTKWVSHKPLTLIRFPDGIYGNKFYSKNAAEFTPDWLPYKDIDDIRFLYIDKLADLVYLANLASLELHGMTISQGQILNPDCMIFDLDPGEAIAFVELKKICADLYHFLIEHGYNPYIKTSGSKGLHIYVPIEPIKSQEHVFEEAKRIGQAFIETNKQTTLKIGKDKRIGKILIDIYRNHRHQTCVLPLSTRAIDGAPVSMPLLYSDLENLSSSNEFNIKNALDYLQKSNPWSDYHINKNINTSSDKNTQEKLSEYQSKRDFEKTPEPLTVNAQIENTKSKFCIQMHDASNLHYDLRLEEEGVLSSWAIPKGLPLKQGVKRLAIRTEDHPLSYLSFEGEIPKGQYGGGTMLVFDKGAYTMILKENNQYHFTLHGDHFKSSYHMIKMKEDQWLVELKSHETPEYEDAKIKPMLAEQSKDIPSIEDYVYEIKWDGIRVQVIKINDDVKILSKSGKNISDNFPEIIAGLKKLEVESCVVDGELVTLDSKGVPVFANIISRLHSSAMSRSHSIKNYPAVLYLFDVMYVDGRPCHELAFTRRRSMLEMIVKKSEAIRISEIFTEGQTLFEGTKAMGLEGIMAKRKTGKYHFGKRSNDWLKIKVRNLIDAFIIGYTKGNGDRADLFGALHLCTRENELVKYLGKVGTGFDQQKLNEIFTKIKEHKIISKPISESVEEEYNTIWIADGPECEIQYASYTSNGTLREPVFYRFKDEI